MRKMNGDVGLFDMDNSLVNYSDQLLADLRLLAAPEEPELGDLWQAEDRFAHIAARMRLIKAIPGWWLNLKPLPSGMRVFRAARRLGFTCAVVSKGPSKHRLAWGEKREWCSKHLGEETLCMITDVKYLTYGKFLYDDFPEYAEGWLKNRKRGLVIMPETDYNRTYSHPRVLKWTGKNWPQVLAALKACRDRKPGEPLKL